MIVILDTNVLLSAALRDRLPERVVLFVFVATDPDIQWLDVRSSLSVEVVTISEFAKLFKIP